MRHLIALVLLLCVSCAALMPTEAEYLSAQEIVAAHADGEPVDAGSLATAREIIEAYEEPGMDWGALGIAAVTALLGVPALRSRGQALVGVGISAIRHGEYRAAARAAVAYVGLGRSGLPSSDSPTPNKGPGIIS